MVSRFLCRMAERLKLQRLIWLVLVALALIGLAVSTGLWFVRRFENGASPMLQEAVTIVRSLVSLDDGLGSVIGSISWSVLLFSAPFLLVVCHQRKAALAALASGYWTNYLQRLISTDYQIALFPPRYFLSRNVDAYLDQVRRQIETDYGIELRETFIKDLRVRRSALMVWKNGQELPIAVDLSRNLTALGDIVDNELSQRFGGIVCTPGYKFEFLAEQYFRRLRLDHLAEGDLNGRVTIVRHKQDFHALLDGATAKAAADRSATAPASSG